MAGYYLSPQQRRSYSLQKINCNLPYFARYSLLLTGVINLNLLKLALEKTLHRHEILRTVYEFHPGEDLPLQVIIESNTLVINEEDWSDLSPEEQENKIHEYLNTLSLSTVNLEQSTPWRLSLITLSLHQYILFMSLPIMSTDPATLKNLIAEISRCYTACLHSEELADEPLQYADLSEWQNNLLESKLGQAYWQQYNFAHFQNFQLPFENQYPENTEFNFQIIRTKIDSHLVKNIAIIAKKYNISTAEFLLTCWQIILWRLTSHQDMIVGTIYDGRKYPELKLALGLFAKFLPVRGHLEDNTTFIQVLQQIHDSVHEVYKWQEYFTWEQASSDLVTGFFAFGFEFEELQIANHDNNILWKIHSQEIDLERFKVKLKCVQSQDDWIAEFHYDAHLFLEADIQLLADQFLQLLKIAAINPQAEISKLYLLSEQEQHKLFLEFNNKITNYPQGKCIHQLFAQQVESTSDNIAIEWENQHLTYAQLNSEANQLARYLQDLGVDPEVLVGICIEGTTQLHQILVGILGILKAGGAYVPLDPGYPQQRLNFMLQDAQISILLTQKHLLRLFPEYNKQVICLDTDWQVIAQYNDANLEWQPAGENLAYIIYTSGSTGTPKGVQITHSNLVHSTMARMNYYENNHIRFLLLSSFAFDSSVAGIFWTLCCGGTLHIPQTGMEKEVVQIIKLIYQYRISHLLCLPSVYTLILEQAQITQLTSLHTVIVAGEPCSPKLVQRHFQLLLATSLFNEYGPTEGTVWSSVYQCSWPEQRMQVSIGRPIANTQIYLLNSHGQPVPIGVAGELYISGDGLARGYLGQPQLTAEKFIPHPFSNQPGARLYKTGDLARYRLDGNLEFLGRVDNQVKIRGFRIELSEIEAVLEQHPAIREAVVLSQENAQGDRYLVSYVVPTSQHLGFPAAEFEIQHISHYQTVYNEIYSQNQNFSHLDSSISLRSWISSYTNQPLPETEVIEYADMTAERILHVLQPQRVLEIGCGTGVILSRVAPHCTYYCGTDISDVALSYTQQQLAIRQPHLLSKVALWQRAAHDFQDLARDQFDTVILNEVIQHFPHLEYLIDVLKSAVNVVRPGGYIFIGGVRSLTLLPAFHTSIQLHKAPDYLSTTQLQQLVQEQVDSEKELILNPDFFTALQQYLPQISYVQICPKRGYSQNELTKFHYDVILHIKAEIQLTRDCPWLNWCEQGLTVPAVRQLLESNQPAILGLQKVPNSRILTEVKAVELLNENSKIQTVGELRQVLQSTVNGLGVNPEEFWALSEELPYIVNISWINAAVDGSYNVVFYRQPAKYPERQTNIVTTFPIATVLLQDLQLYAHQPLYSQSKLANEWVSQLRSYLQHRLPDYMVPAKYLMLETLPRTPNGKVNRQALPVPDQARSICRKTLICPRDSLELQLVQIWEEVLDIRPVGVTDNFFDLGGHSLLAVRLMAHIRTRLKQDLPLSVLFQRVSVEQLASILRQQNSFQIDTSIVALQPNGTKQPFFCVHPASGHVFCYYELARQLGLEQPFYALQAWGLDGKQEPHHRIEDMAGHYIQLLRTIQPQGPYLLGGWSMGGVLAFEMAYQLQQQGEQVNLLALLDSLAPVAQHKPDIDESDDAQVLAKFAQDMASAAGKNLSIFYEQLQQLKPDEQLEYFLAQAKIAQLVPPDVSNQQLRCLVRVFQKNMQAILKYVPRVYPYRITLFKASDRNPEQEIQHPALGWDELSSESVEIINISGDHCTILTEPHVKSLQKQLRYRLDQAQKTVVSQRFFSDE